MQKTTQATPSLRVNAENPNHHLYLNNGTWWLHFTVHCGPTKARKRCSLRTGDELVARRRRDRYLGRLLKGETCPRFPRAERRAA